MKKLATILYLMCFGLLLLANVYRMSSVAQNDGADIESVAGLGDTEEVKNMGDAPVFMEEQALPTPISALLMPEEKAAFYIRHTTDLPWQHAEMPLLPPEFSSCLS